MAGNVQDQAALGAFDRRRTFLEIVDLAVVIPEVGNRLLRSGADQFDIVTAISVLGMAGVGDFVLFHDDLSIGQPRVNLDNADRGRPRAVIRH